MLKQCTMPYYDESFISHDNQNQRRNKRSYRVYKTGVVPLDGLERDEDQALLPTVDNDTCAVRRNLRNGRRREKKVLPPALGATVTCDRPDIIKDHLPRVRCLDLPKSGHNVPSLTSCKSFDTLILRKVGNEINKHGVLKNGSSLQNLACSNEDQLKHYVSPLEDGLTGERRGKDDNKKSYSVVEARRRIAARPRRPSRGTPSPGVGIYRQINEVPARRTLVVTESDSSGGGEGGWTHRGSLRGANKLARRARSFKDDLMERINNMRSPAQAQHPPHLNTVRSHSPLSPKLRSAGAKATPLAEDGEVTPAKELERLVKEVTFGLKHFSDVITKRKLEMLPDNGTIVFESIANIHKAIKPYCIQSPTLTSAVKRLCAALAMMIRLCDEITSLNMGGERLEPEGAAAEALSPERVARVVRGLASAVEQVATLGCQQMARPTLAPRPALVSPRNSTQRNSLPDIPLSQKEQSLLAVGARGSAGEPGGVRASHSSESVLDAPDTPPPKPARPTRVPLTPNAHDAHTPRRTELAPPLPPKRRSGNDSSLLALSIDRPRRSHWVSTSKVQDGRRDLQRRLGSLLSLKSHSSGSLDSVLNISNEEERTGHTTDRLFYSPPNADVLDACSCTAASEPRSSLESQGSHVASMHSHSHHRFSNESGFASVGPPESSLEPGYAASFSTQSSHHYCAQVDRVSGSRSAETEVTSTVGSELPPELPAKTRRALRADLQQHFPNVEIRGGVGLGLSGGELRPHTLAEHHPPPLPLKKKHMFQSVAYSVMAYMEMFGNCSHPASAAAAAASSADMFRHSIHTYNLASTQPVGPAAVNAATHRHHHVHRTIAQSFTVQHFGAQQHSGTENAAFAETASPHSAALELPPSQPPALPPKMNKPKQIMFNSSVDNIGAPPSPRPPSRTALPERVDCEDTNSDESFVCINSLGKFPVEEEPEAVVELPPSPPSSPVPSQQSEGSAEMPATSGEAGAETADILIQTDVTSWLVLRSAGKDEPEVRGGHPDALIVLATKATRDFAYQEAFLATYRTWVSPSGLVARLVRRAHHFASRPHELRSTLSLLTRVVADLTMADLDGPLMQEIMEFIYWLVDVEELPIAKALRQILVDKQKQLRYQQSNHRYEYESPCFGTVTVRRDTLLDFKATELAEQMTILDAALFVRITTAEVLSWPRDQSEESSPNLTRFTAHFNKMSYWARSRILEQDESERREKYASKFLKVMKALRKLNNFNSYLALVSALDSPPVRRLEWPRAVRDTLNDYCAIIEPSSSFRAYRQALADTQPPCIPYIGLVLQDLTFVHIGNPDLLSDGTINFTKRWQQYHIMENMKRFHKDRQYKFKKNERIQAMFNEFDDVLSEEAMWQISETIKPRPGRTRPSPVPAPPTSPAPAAVPAPTAAAAQTAA